MDETTDQPVCQQHLESRMDGTTSHGLTNLKTLPAGQQTNVTQRQIPASDKSPLILRTIYDALLHVPSFAALTDQIGLPMNLRWYNREEMEQVHAGTLRKAFYDNATQTIELDRGFMDNIGLMRNLIILELSHARTPAGPLAAPQPEDSAELDQEDLAMCTTAVDALRVDYHEWISVFVNFLMTLDENHELRQDGQAEHDEIEEIVQPRYERAFLEGGWFSFENYLNHQVASGHISKYDPAATGDDWAGFILFSNAGPAGLFTISDYAVLQSIASMVHYPDQWIGDLTARPNPFAGAAGTGLLARQMEIDRAGFMGMMFSAQ